MKEGPIEIGRHTVEVSNLDKVFFPERGLAKGDLVAYYRDIAETLLPHLEGRPLILERFPDGIEAEGFIQQAAGDYFPHWIRTVAVERRGRGGTVDHVLVCDEEATLVYLANQATVTFHRWASRADAVDHPDLVVFDLDPGDGGIGELRDAARKLRDLLDEIGLVPFAQTSGSRGFHVVAPLDRSADFDMVRTFARDVAERVVAREPDRFTVEQRLSKRGGRLYIDTNRNAYAQTAAAPYSVRARPGAPVVTPIDWHELGRVEPESYTITNIFRRLGQKEDPWAGIDGETRALAPARKRLDALRAEESSAASVG